jgi:hypothetical protein
MANVLDDYGVNEVDEVGRDEVNESTGGNEVDESTGGDEPEKKGKVRKSKTKTNADIEEKREQLSILVVQGSIEPYAGREMSLGDVIKLPPKEVEKIHNRYKASMATVITSGLTDSILGLGIRILSKIVPLDNENELHNEIKSNELIKQELNNVAGYVILKGGRFVALASCLLQVASHVDFSKSEPEIDNSLLTYS